MFYSCKYCYKKFEPTRRRVQKYCSNSCRSKAYHLRKTEDSSIAVTGTFNKMLPNISLAKFQVEKMSAAGIGNATVGTLAASVLKNLITHVDNKPATKGDLKNLVSEITGRYHVIKNMATSLDGALPYFDIETNSVVYLHITDL